ncbi:TetR/AcrR family transcriptional regulator [Leifsonia sp. H3M29-4]|jgi:AcrR family transcriptional regulator|uniref:TetR/AcrR family transcriptional regulator n=1 Tax=Salinibacterium metalliresistens TaxID=3031321 RepID=UPI0023DABC9E|nr:TetR/AcrR family transcriptional regulator [Salinibacterium metalliresistens]MDF1478815.1 TetR/AcrR family transcriptional regulator [Salinibacterium metalliresistens]
MTSPLVQPARRSKADERIVAATLDILRSRGPLAVSVESVAAASGVAKTTIYRRFSNRASLLTGVVTSASAAVAIPTDLTTRETLGWVLRNASDTIEQVIGRGTVAAVLANEDPEFTTLLLEMIRTSTRPLRDTLRARVEAGEIPDEIDIELVMSMLLGVVIAELIRGRETDDAWVESVLGLIWPAFEAR